MNDFKVTEIVNATTIRVDPQFSFPNSGGAIVDDKIKISGLNVDDNNEKVIKRLRSFLLNKNIEAFDPVITVAQTAPIECHILLSNVDIVYYFPEYHPA